MLSGAEIITAEGTSTASYVYDGDAPECRTRPGNQVIAAVDVVDAGANN